VNGSGVGIVGGDTIRVRMRTRLAMLRDIGVIAAEIPHGARETRNGLRSYL
jgi:hypothetical protein